MQCQFLPQDNKIIQAILIAESPRMAYAGAQSLYAFFADKILFKEVHDATINAAYEDARIFGKRNVRKRGTLDRPDRQVLNSSEIQAIVDWFSESNEDERTVELGRIFSMFDPDTIYQIYEKISPFLVESLEQGKKDC